MGLDKPICIINSFHFIKNFISIKAAAAEFLKYYSFCSIAKLIVMDFILLFGGSRIFIK